MLIDDGICENCLAKNHCDVLPYSNNCNEVRAMAKHDKQVYNKAVDDFVNLAKEHDFKHDKKDISNCVIGFIEFFAEQLKAGVLND